MPINSQNILAHEWMGLEVSIQDCSDPNLRGLSGRVRDETKNTLVIENEGRSVRVAKPHTVFLVTLPTREILTVEGDLLRHRPEDRIKKGLNKW